jgi:translation initiation factor IF-1
MITNIFGAMPKEGQIITEGTVTQVLPGTMFRVDLSGQRNVLAHIVQNAQALYSDCSRR